MLNLITLDLLVYKIQLLLVLDALLVRVELNKILLFELPHLLLHQHVQFLLVSLPLKKVFLFGDFIGQSLMPSVSLTLINRFSLLDHHALALLPVLVQPEVLRLLVKFILDPTQPLVLNLGELLAALLNCVLLVLTHEVQSMLI